MLLTPLCLVGSFVIATCFGPGDFLFLSPIAHPTLFELWGVSKTILATSHYGVRPLTVLVGVRPSGLWTTFRICWARPIVKPKPSELEQPMLSHYASPIALILCI